MKRKEENEVLKLSEKEEQMVFNGGRYRGMALVFHMMSLSNVVSCVNFNLMA